LERGLVLDDRTIQQLIDEKDSFVAGQQMEALRWPEEPLRAVLVRSFSTLGRFGQRPGRWEGSVLGWRGWGAVDWGVVHVTGGAEQDWSVGMAVALAWSPCRGSAQCSLKEA